ncbi:MAG TPA: hypothetical protein VG838_03685 [Opitutaceae bacterium]|nr:hypothetical protein [Opitutaceae bacterium]
MTTLNLRFLLALALVSAGAGSARADVAAVIAKARSYLGPDAALDAVTSVHFVGTLVTSEDTPAGPKPVEAQVEIIFQKPYRQRIIATSERKVGDTVEQRVEITALDNYEGWHRVQDAKDPRRWNMDLLQKDDVKRLRANTWENLSFYRGIEQRGGRIEDLGPATINGVACQKLAFRHEPGIVFIRYFDLSTGRLVLTETEQGGTIREEGELMANGIRFPKKVVTTTKMTDGKERSVTVNFEKVTLNEKFDPALFEIPSLLTK